jgi:parallel beta-helix repeat protein
MALTKASFSMITGTPVNVQDFGAVADGNIPAGTGTDNTAFIQAAINSVNGSGSVYLPAGVYKITSTINVPSGVTFSGAGNYVSFLMVANAFANANGALRANGTGGPPTVFENMAVVAQNGGAAAGAVGINSATNGVIIRNVWVAAFPTNIILASSDNILLDSISEEATTGVSIISPSVTVANCVLYGCTTGISITNAPYLDSTISISNCRATNCAQNGFYITNSSNIQLSNCSAGHNIANKFTVSAVGIEASSNVDITNFIARLGTKSTQPNQAAFLIKSSSGNVNINNAQITNFLYGIYSIDTYQLNISDSIVTSNGADGIYVSGGDRISISNNICTENIGQGIYSNNSLTFAIHSITSNICTQVGAGTQLTGIGATIVNNGANSGFTNIVGNTCKYNTTAQIATSGVTANINLSGNLV